MQRINFFYRNYFSKTLFYPNINFKKLNQAWETYFQETKKKYLLPNVPVVL